MKLGRTRTDLDCRGKVGQVWPDVGGGSGCGGGGAVVRNAREWRGRDDARDLWA